LVVQSNHADAVAASLVGFDRFDWHRTAGLAVSGFGLDGGDFDCLDTGSVRLGLELALKPPRRPVFDNFIASGNEALVETLASGLEASHWYLLAGPSGSGKSHLLSSIFQQQIDADLPAVYIPLSTQSGWQLLEQVSARLVLVDDIDALAGDALGEMQLFNALNRWREERTLVVMSAHALSDFVLPDLCSRIGQATRLTLKPLDEDGLEALAMRLANDQEMAISVELARYLVSRVRRNAGEVTQWMNRVMAYALGERRAITIPMIRSVLIED